MTVSSAALGRLVLGGGALGQSSPKASPGAIVEYTPYISSSKWIRELHKYEIKIVDSAVSRTNTLEIIIANPLNAAEGIYSEYQFVRVRERNTKKIIFYGRVEEIVPIFDSSYGQSIRIIAKNMIRELVDRNLNTNFVAQTRSAAVSTIVTNYIYAGALTQDIEASGSAETISRDYQNTNVSPIKGIEELGLEDPWSDADFDAAWQWDNSAGAWVDNTVECASAAGVAFDLLDQTTDFHYFGQNNPFWGLIVDLAVVGVYSNVTYEYWNGIEWTIFYPALYNGFSANSTINWYAPDDWQKRTITNGDPHAAAPPDGTSRYWMRVSAAGVTTTATVNQILPVVGYGYDFNVDVDKVFHYFRRGSLPAGGAGSLVSAFTDSFGTAVAAPVATPEWIGEVYLGSAENSTADINTTTAGKAYVIAAPDGTPANTGYWLRKIPQIDSQYFRVHVDVDCTWNVSTGFGQSVGLRIIPGTTYDANNDLYISRLNVGANFILSNSFINGVEVGNAGLLADDVLAFAIERNYRTWTLYYSLTQTPYTWVLYQTLVDTNNYLTDSVSVVLFCNTAGVTAGTNTAQGDFDNFELFDKQGLTLKYLGKSTFSERPMYQDFSIQESPREIFTRVIVEGVDGAGARVVGSATNSTLESSLRIIKEKKFSIKQITSAADCTKKANALLSLFGGSVIRGKVSIHDYPYYKFSGVYHIVKAGDTVFVDINTNGVAKAFIVLEISYEEPPGTATLTLLERKRGLVFSPTTLESRLEDILARLERTEQIV